MIKIKVNKVFILMIFIFLIFVVFFCVKKIKTGNNIINQDDVKNIFNIHEYEAEIEVTITSNKNENKYKIIQKCNIDSGESTQELIEPENLKGIKITNQNNTIKLENTELKLNKVFENYNLTTKNDMDLDVFLEDFKLNSGTSQENENEIILETTSNNDNKYTKTKLLYINKKTGKPTKMEIKDTNKKDSVYIVYNKVEFK